MLSFNTNWNAQHLCDEEVLAARAVMEFLDAHEHGQQWKDAICSAFDAGFGDSTDAISHRSAIFDLARAFVEWVDPVTVRIAVPVLARVHHKLTKGTYMYVHENYMYAKILSTLPVKKG